MPYSAIKNKSFSFTTDGYFNQFGLKSVIQDIAPKFLRPSDKYILMVASEHATASDQLCIFKSLKTIAEQCGVSKDTVRRSLTRCVELGILAKSFVIDKKTGKQKPCLYTYTKRFVWIAMAFRRMADTLKSRRQKDFKVALERFNTALQKLAFRAKLSFPSLKNKLFSKGYPPKSALKQGLQNASQRGSKTDPNKVITDQVNKYTAPDVSAKRDDACAQKITTKNGAIHFIQDISKKFAAIASRNAEKKSKPGNRKTLVQSHRTTSKPKTVRTAGAYTSEGFNHARFQEANRLAEKDWEERQRIARENPPEKQTQRLAQLRALLDNAKAQKAGR